MGKQFENVSSTYGAPMGRHCVPDLDTTRGTVRLFKVNLDRGGYDDGGAYWGHGAPIYCARDRHGDIQTVRAGSREEAAFLLDIPAPALARSFDWRRMAQRWRDAGRAFAGLHVGPFTLSEIRPDGSAVIGCHDIPHSELAAMAERLNLPA